MKVKIESYSIIYSIDALEEYLYLGIPKDLENWTETENGQSDFIDEWSHKKFLSILTPEEFNKFIEDQGLYAEDVETLGSLGAPGYGYGWSPTISFISYDEDIIKNAYVTPNITEKEARKHKCKDLWNKIFKQVLEEYQ